MVLAAVLCPLFDNPMVHTDEFLGNAGSQKYQRILTAWLNVSYLIYSPVENDILL